MRLTLISSALAVSALLASCGGGGEKNLAERASGDMEAYENSDVDAIEQARPEIMIIPSDGTLKKFRALTDGTDGIERDYQKYLLTDGNARELFSTIQGQFQKNGFPLNDLEQTLKQLNTQAATDLADGLEKDAKTMLLTVASPDIILELDYGKSGNNVLRHGNNQEKETSFTLNAIDPYTNKVIGTFSSGPIKGRTIAEAVNNELSQRLPELMNDLVKYFSETLKRGREVTVRVAIEEGSNIALTDVNAEGDTYADYINDYIKTHTIKGAYKLQRNTDNELYFTGCRIKLLNDDGTQYGVYDWTRELARAMRKDLGVKVTNKAQGLGEVMLTISGI